MKKVAFNTYGCASGFSSSIFTYEDNLETDIVALHEIVPIQLKYSSKSAHFRQFLSSPGVSNAHDHFLFVCIFLFVY